MGGSPDRDSKPQFGSSQPRGDELMDELVNSLFTEDSSGGGSNPFAPSEQSPHAHASALGTGTKLTSPRSAEGGNDSTTSSPGQLSSDSNFDSNLGAGDLMQLGDSLLDDMCSAEKELENDMCS